MVAGTDKISIFVKQVYKQILLKMQEYLPDFKIANAVIHFDEVSPHMHVVGNSFRGAAYHTWGSADNTYSLLFKQCCINRTRNG